MGTTPVFNEVIGISFDTAGFQQSIQQLKEMWADALEGMSGTAPTVGTSNTDAISDSVEKLADQLKQLQESYNSTVETLAETLSESVAGQTSNVSSSFKETSASAKKAATDVVNEFADMANQSEEALERFHDAARKFLQGNNQPSALTTNAQLKVYQGLQSVGEGEQINALDLEFEQLSAKQREWFVNFSQTISQAEDRLRDFGKDAPENEQRRLQQQVAMQERANAQMLADFRKSISAKIAAGQLDLDAVERLTAQEAEIYDQEARKFAAVWEQAYAEKGRRAKEQPQPKEPSPTFGQSFASGFAETISPESLGNLAGIQLAWTGIGAAIGLASKAVEQVDNLFKSGFEYAQELEQKAALLQGVIASNVKLSQDFEENYKIAGDAATQIQRKLEDAAIRYGLTVGILERGFKQLVDGGGVSLVKNLDEAQQVAVLFSVALQAAGKDAETTRAILSELPKMLTGTEKPSGLILETLNLTTKQWDAIVARAKTHHDLLEQLSPLMQNYAKVAEDAANRQRPLMESIGLEVKRIMAAGESSPFNDWTKALQEIKQFLEEDHSALEAAVGTIVEGVESLGKMVVSVGELGTSLTPVEGSFKNIWLDILAMVEGVTTLFTGISTLSNILNRFANVKAGENFKNDWKDATEYAKQQIQSFNDSFEESAKRLYAADKGHPYVKLTGDNNFQQYMAQQGAYVPGSDGVIDRSPGPGSRGVNDLSKPKYDNSALRDLQKQYADQSALSKQRYEAEIQQNNTLLAQRKLSVEQVDADNAKAAHSEYLRQMEVIEATRNATKNLRNVKPDAVRGFNESLDTKSTNLGTQEQQRVSAETVKSIKATLAAQDQADTESIASIRKITEAKIAEIKRAEEAGLVSTRTMLATEEVYTRAAKNSTDQLYDELIARAGADSARVNQLTAEKTRADAVYTAKFQEFSSQRIEAQLKEFDAAQEAVLKQAKLVEEKIVAANSGRKGSNNPNIAAQQSLNSANAQLEYTKAVLASAQAELQEAENAGKVGEALKRKRDALTAAQGAEIAALAKVAQAKQAQIDQSHEGSAAFNLGDSLSSTFGDFKTHSADFSKDFASSVENLGEAINTFHESANNLYSAFEHGGLLGGTGAAASTAGGLVSSLSHSLGSAFQSFAAVGGPMLSAVGTLFSSISSIFTQEAQDIANTIEKNLTNANNAYQDQTATLVQTLAAVQQQRQDAINQLSGVKGGQDQLDKLLPQIDQEIAQLQLQIKEAMVTFTNSLQDLNLNNTALSAAFDKWQEINKQVQAYLSAGGSVAAANKYISESLEAMKTAAGDALNQGYQTAIQDAENLNNLIQQRMQLEQQEAQSEFNTINGDALERRGTKAINTGTQLQQQKAQYQQQLDALNSQVDLAQQKVALESQEFDLSMSMDQLRETSNNLQIAQLKEQLAILQAQKDIYNGITQGADGSYTASQTLMNEIGVVNIIVQAGGTAGDDSAANPNDVADAVSNVLNTWSRAGLGTYIGKT